MKSYRHLNAAKQIRATADVPRAGFRDVIEGIVAAFAVAFPAGQHLIQKTLAAGFNWRDVVECREIIAGPLQSVGGHVAFAVEAFSILHVHETFTQRRRFLLRHKALFI